MKEVVANIRYESDDGWRLTLEYGKTPDDKWINGRMVLRNADHEFIDIDRDHVEIAKRNNLKLEWSTDTEQEEPEYLERIPMGSKRFL
jgi:hypothetical protein